MQDLIDILHNKLNIPKEDLNELKNQSIETGSHFKDIILKKKEISEEEYLKAFGEAYKIPFISDIDADHIEYDFTENLSIKYLKKHSFVPLKTKDDVKPLRNGSPCIAVSYPSEIHAIEDIAKSLNYESFDMVLMERDKINEIINKGYDLNQDSAQQLVDDMEEDGDSLIRELESIDLLEDTSDSPIIKLVNHMISQSIKATASDIHIEPYQDSFKIRYRIDGILYDLLSPPKRIQSPLISRIKVMAGLDIAEKRLPQDGRIEVTIGGTDVDIRVSTIPTTFGERVVLRLLNKSGTFLELSEFGISGERLNQIKELIKIPNGIILVTGPTGSGKTTTLYATLSSINSTDKNIITIEDPVEYQIEGIGQIQVNRKINLTFAKGLRSIVRQDPDVILVGEIRDGETAEIAVQSALTGHLVFSTLHTNDSASAITRLVEFGIEPFLITSSVKAVIAQRLLRVLCDNCKEKYIPNDIILENLGISKEVAEKATFYKSKGCGECFSNGYSGRVAIFEIFVLDNGLKDEVLKTSDSNRLMELAISKGMVSLRDDGIEKILNGVTTIEEVLRVT
ncbi:MAG: type II secretion system ATPase GspE [Desulfobacterales bacterium]|nr:type II secretion system ATPase GspE [Desulfobacterales bacterium]